jgi:putative component of membrane protein insertase Oxa1/YidC/SpoIIIJ protein YidD
MVCGLFLIRLFFIGISSLLDENCSGSYDRKSFDETPFTEQYFIKHHRVAKCQNVTKSAKESNNSHVKK